MIDKEALRNREPHRIRYTQHAADRCRKRDIRHKDIVWALENGEIIEQYLDDYPYPSCLVSCDSLRHLHIVVGVSEHEIIIITAYFASDEKWEPDYRTRKVKTDG